MYIINTTKCLDSSDSKKKFLRQIILKNLKLIIDHAS
jgi:hypothetical protein